MRSDALYRADMSDAIECLVTGVDEARCLSDATGDALPGIPWKEVIVFRNTAAHAHFPVDWRIVSVTVMDELPVLKQSISTYEDS